MKNCSYFLNFLSAKEFAQKNKGSVITRNPKGDGWMVTFYEQSKIQSITRMPEKEKKLKLNKNSYDKWIKDVKGNFSKQTSVGVLRVIKIKGEWHLNMGKQDLNNGFAFKSSMMAIHKAEMIINFSNSKRAKIITKEFEVNNEDSERIIHTSIATKPTSQKLVPRKMVDWDGIGGSRDQVKKMRGWKLS